MGSQRWRQVSGAGFLAVVVAVGVGQFVGFPYDGGVIKVTTVTEGALFLTIAVGLVVVPFSETLSTVDADAAASIYSPILVGLGLLAVRSLTDFLGEFLVQPDLFVSVFEDVTGILGFGAVVVGLVRWNDHYEGQAHLLERRQERLEGQNERLEQFARVVAHDLRNPLEVAQGRLTYARETGDEEHFEEMASALDRIEEMISEVMSLARAGEESVDRRDLDLEPVVDDAWATVETGGGALEFEAGSDATVPADEALLRQLFENLFRNAVEHGGNPVTVRVGLLTDGFYVEDTGPGIDPADRDDAFQVGYTTDPAGTGLGLHIVEEIASAHGWSAAIAESDDGGARFEFHDVSV